MRPRRGLGVLVALGVLPLAACTPDVSQRLAVPAERARLFSGLRSYDPPDAVRRQLGGRPLTLQRAWKGKTSGCGGFTWRLELHTLARVEHLGVRGLLRLTFLNDRLVRASFRPDDLTLYYFGLERQLGLRVKPPLDRRVDFTGAPRHVRVRSEPLDGQLWVTWEDRRLMPAYWEIQSRGSSRYLD